MFLGAAGYGLQTQKTLSAWTKRADLTRLSALAWDGERLQRQSLARFLEAAPTSSVVLVGDESLDWAKTSATAAANIDIVAADANQLKHTDIAALCLSGAIANFRALKRRLIAAGKATTDAGQADLLAALLGLYLQRGAQLPEAMRAALSLTSGDLAMALLVQTPQGPLLGAAARGSAQLETAAGENECAFSTQTAAFAGGDFDLVRRAGSGDCVLARPHVLTLIDEHDMIIERALTRAGVAASASCASSAHKSEAVGAPAAFA